MSEMFRRAAILGLLSAVGPFAIDMYLPAMPSMTTDLSTDIATTQLTLTAFFLSFGIAQLFYGPWADAAGRKVPLYVGLGIYVLASIWAAFAPDIDSLILARAVQGLGASAVMVIPRAIIRDWSTGTEATRLMAMVMLVISVSPMLAPLAGSLVILVADWRAIFWVMTIAGIASLAATAFALPETLPPERRRPIVLRGLLRDAGFLFRHKGFMVLTFIGAFGMGSFFVFIASAAFVYTEAFGLSPIQFSLAFAVNAAGFFGGSQLASGAGERLGMGRVVQLATGCFAVCALLLLALDLAGFAGLATVIVLLAAGNFCLGFVIPSVMVMALDDQGAVAGLASSLGGTLQMITGGVMVAIAGPFFDGSVTPMIVVIAFCAVMTVVLARLVPGQAATSAT